MKRQKLYIKNEKGRYVEYEEPMFDNALYRRVGKKYVPCSMAECANSWGEGVYAVTKNEFGQGITSAKYLKEIFSACRCGDIEKVSIAKLGGMEKLANHLMCHWGDIKGTSVFEQCASIVSILLDYENQVKND